jgi:hypothetical protein
VLLREEVNVEEVRVVSGELPEGEPWMAVLDMVITPELRQKGQRREFVRHVMSARKEAGLKPVDLVRVLASVPIGEMRQGLEADLSSLAREARAISIEIVESFPSSVLFQKEFEMAEMPCRLALVKMD